MSRRPSLRKRSSSKMEHKVEIAKNEILRTKLFRYCKPSCISISDSLDITKVGKSSKSSESWKRFLKPALFISAFVIIAVLLIYFLHPRADTVCYIRLGCFSVSGPWSERPALFNFVPQSPSVINTTFIITSRTDPTGKYGLVKNPNFGHSAVVNINEDHIPWKNSSIIVFLNHGYTDRSGTWMQTLKDAFLAQSENIIVILVDWKPGASGYYPQVVANTRVVAREITLFIRYIQRRFGRDSTKRIHLVGHSLGAQISGYVGKAFINSSYPIYQITALDPAFPFFEGYCPEIRLDKDDALQVLVIHSNVGPWGLGMKNPVGDVDIYLNDGRLQRGCPRLWKEGDGSDDDKEQEPVEMKVDNKSLPKILVDKVKDLTGCSHRRAYAWLEDILRDITGTLFVESNHPIRPTPVVAYPLKMMDNGTDIMKLTKNRQVQFSNCEEHSKLGCWKLEKDEENALFRLPNLDLWNGSSTFFIPTSDKSPFCVRFALVEISICPVFSMASPLQKWDSKMTPENVTVTLTQAVFDEEIKVYQGFLYNAPKIQAWVEFSCHSLQNPVHLLEHVDDEKESDQEHFLSVKLAVSLETSGSTKNKEQAKGTSRSTSDNRNDKPSLCVNQVKLVYYNETAKETKRIHWRSEIESAISGIMEISPNECVEIKFPL